MGDMINKTKKYLNNIAKTHTLTETKQIIKKLVEHPDFTEIEKWLIYYTYGEGRMVANTCAKLSISERQFYLLRNIVLIKLYYILGL